MTFDELTPEEQSLIEREREKQKAKLAGKKLQIHILNTAVSYLGWLSDMKSGLTFSSFINEFGYELPSDLGVDVTAQNVHQWASELIAKSHVCVCNVPDIGFYYRQN